MMKPFKQIAAFLIQLTIWIEKVAEKVAKVSRIIREAFDKGGGGL